MSKPIRLVTREGLNMSVETDKALAKWQKILRCQDWDIDVSVDRYSKMVEGGLAGYIHRDYTHKYAHVHLIDPVDIDKSTWHEDNTFPYDMEQVLVHELLHLGTNYFEPDEDGIMNDQVEQFIDQMAWALVRLDRQGEDPIAEEQVMRGPGGDSAHNH
jgi:hypothetical protein